MPPLPSNTAFAIGFSGDRDGEWIVVRQHQNTPCAVGEDRALDTAKQPPAHEKADQP